MAQMMQLNKNAPAGSTEAILKGSGGNHHPNYATNWRENVKR